MIHTKTEQFKREKFIKDVGIYRNILLENNIRTGDRVILTEQNSYSFLVSFFALVELDCSIVLVDYSTSDKEIQNIFLNSLSKYCITNRTIPHLEENILIPFINHPINNSNKKEIDIEKWKNRRDALILYSSGSTGKSKGIIKSGQSFFSSQYSTMERQGYKSSDILLPLVPFTHIYGISLVFVWWLIDCELVICDYKKGKSIIKDVVEKNVTIVDAVPPTFYMIKQLLQKKPELCESFRRSSVRMCCTGGSPLSTKLADDFFSLTGRLLLDAYGLTETGNISFNLSDYRMGTGPLLPDVQIKIIDTNGNEVPKGEIGEILMKGPGMMEGYLGQPEATKKAFLDGWYRTNDFGYFDRSDNLFVIGRMGNAFSRKGNIVYPASIEKVIQDSIGLTGKIVAFPDEKKDSFVILIIEGNIKEKEKIKKAIYQNVEELFIPDKIIFLEEFRYLPNGKLDGKWIQENAELYWNRRMEKMISY